MIKEAILNSEKEKVKEFLLKFDLNYESSVDLTLYIIILKTDIVKDIVFNYLNNHHIQILLL